MWLFLLGLVYPRAVDPWTVEGISFWVHQASDKVVPSVCGVCPWPSAICLGPSVSDRLTGRLAQSFHGTQAFPSVLSHPLHQQTLPSLYITLAGMFQAPAQPSGAPGESAREEADETRCASAANRVRAWSSGRHGTEGAQRQHGHCAVPGDPSPSR